MCHRAKHDPGVDSAELFPPVKRSSAPAAENSDANAESSNGVVTEAGDNKLSKTTVARLLKKMQTRLAEK